MMNNQLLHPTTHLLIRALLMLPILLCIAAASLKLLYGMLKFSGFGSAFLPTRLAEPKCGASSNKRARSTIVLGSGPTGFRSRKQVGSTWELGPSAFVYSNPGRLLRATGSF